MCDENVSLAKGEAADRCAEADGPIRERLAPSAFVLRLALTSDYAS